MGPIIIPKLMKDLTISQNKPGIQLCLIVGWEFLSIKTYLLDFEEQTFARASQQSSWKRVVNLTTGGNLKTWLCWKKNDTDLSTRKAPNTITYTKGQIRVCLHEWVETACWKREVSPWEPLEWFCLGAGSGTRLTATSLVQHTELMSRQVFVARAGWLMN